MATQPRLHNEAKKTRGECSTSGRSRSIAENELSLRVVFNLSEDGQHVDVHNSNNHTSNEGDDERYGHARKETIPSCKYEEYEDGYLGRS